MPVTKIRITFERVFVSESGDIWGDGDWHFTAKVDGKAVGNPKTEFEAKEKKWINLPPKDWSIDLDVSKKKAGDEVRIDFSAVDEDVFSDDDLGAVTAKLKFPFRKEGQLPPLKSPVIKGFLFMPDHQYYTLIVSMKILEATATAALSGPGSVAVSRQNDGSSTFNTVAGGPITPRVEVCEIIPTPTTRTNTQSGLPDRPKLPATLAMGIDTPQSQPVPMFPIPANLNALVNPSLIPALKKTDPDLRSKAARLAVTYAAPGDLDLNFITWHIKSGPVEFVGSNEGPEVMVRGTDGSGDKMAEFEIRWDGPKGNLLTTFRAWTGPVKEVPYRVNLIMGSKAATSPVLTGANVDNHIKMARTIFWQAGLELVPDPDKTCYDGATTTDASGSAHPDGVFNVPAGKDKWTVDVHVFKAVFATHLNFRPGVLNIAFVRSSLQGRAAASDIQGVPKSPKAEKLDGVPSASWVHPCGIALDPAPSKAVEMKVFPHSHSNKYHDDYTKLRIKTDAGFKKASLDQLFAVVVPADWDPNGDAPDSGVNLAHELGHALGLMHRGSGDSGSPPLSDDGVNSLDKKKKKRGHPWHENTMSYGYGGNANPPRALDIDIIQAPVIRRHPAAKVKP